MGDPHAGSLPLDGLVVIDSIASQALQLPTIPSSMTTVLDHSSLLPLLDALTATDNHTRNVAEHTFKGLKESQPEALVYGLLEVSAL